MKAFDLEVWYGERVAVLGSNGSGKSHFLRLLAAGGSHPDVEHRPVGDVPIKPVDHDGRAELGARVRPGRFVQTHEHPELVGRTLLEVLRRGDGSPGGRAGMGSEAAARVLDRYELAHAGEQSFESLSGDQQARFQTPLLELSDATLLLLDESTDNLDVQSVEALEAGLEAFDGTVPAVTHDRWFARGFDRYLVTAPTARSTSPTAPSGTRGSWCEPGKPHLRPGASGHTGRVASRVLTSLSPARRRFAVGVVVLAVIAVASAIGAALLRRDPPVRPVAQDRSGPVLLVPGYGGSTVALEVLADALETAGRDVRIVEASGPGTGDLREGAADLARAVEATLEETGAPSVDVVGYSAGGVVLRLYVADLGGGSTVRRAVTLASPHHGTDLASLAISLGTRACPMACEQLDPDSDLLRGLNAGVEAPAGPVWVVLWTEDDKTVVPPVSGDLEGALGYAVQSICPALTVAHRDIPRTPAVIAMVESALGTPEPVEPDASVCTS